MQQEPYFGEQKETVGLATGGQPYQATGAASEPVEKRPTLSDAGISKTKRPSRSGGAADR